MTKRHPSGWNTFQKSYVIINVQKNTFYFKKVGTNHTGLPLLRKRMPSQIPLDLPGRCEKAEEA